jgi:hypothetical protein
MISRSVRKGIDSEPEDLCFRPFWVSGKEAAMDLVIKKDEKGTNEIDTVIGG